jgi:hypothetical protein
VETGSAVEVVALAAGAEVALLVGAGPVAEEVGPVLHAPRNAHQTTQSRGPVIFLRR